MGDTAFSAETSQGGDGALHLPARTILPPKSISPRAQAFLAEAAMRGPPPLEPPPTDLEAWRKRPQMEVELLKKMVEHFKGETLTIPLPGGASIHQVTPAGRSGRSTQVAVLDIHGGGFVSGGGDLCRDVAMIRAGALGAEYFAVDYRMPPDHPYPTPLDDCLAAYREVLSRYPATNLVVSGASAGGNLAAALMLRARDESLPLPAGLVLDTPEVDLTQSGDTFVTNQILDVALYRPLNNSIALYAQGHDLRHPYLSPLFGDFTKGWPPTILTSGTRDLFLSNTVLMHRALRRAHVAAELHVCEAAPHGGFMGRAPEDLEMAMECIRFTKQRLGMSA